VSDVLACRFHHSGTFELIHDNLKNVSYDCIGCRNSGEYNEDDAKWTYN
jgi:hypothetical protein